jgi:energy-coupling factor transporter ATP-binding protein EcfA2
MRSTPAEVSIGSQWRRWDPHLHAPGTLLNDQFSSDWEGYLSTIESASPVIEALGVTDYFSLGCYSEVRARQRAGRLPSVNLLFPNVEMRLDLATEKRRPVNLHLLFSPEDPDHETEIERALAELSFEYKGRGYRCSASGLEDLGRAHNPSRRDDDAARREGAKQFKTTLDKLRALFRGDSWVTRNCIVAVSASSNDGTSGLKADDSFAAMRREVERFAQVIFTATANDRDFWLGKHLQWDVASFEREYGGRKPCLHGSDAHDVPKTGNPDQERYCWIKGDATFESLRQAILEPEERVWIGSAAPERHDAGLCVAEAITHGTPWLMSGRVRLNPGLVAIIGSRGSGKTALADIIAAGANVSSPHALGSSFLSRASSPVNHLGDARVELRWGDGSVTASRLSRVLPDNGCQDGECVRYLSQQFVEQLCSAQGLAVELRQEIERVIFEATDPGDRLDADSFEQLAGIHLTPIRRQRETLKEAIEKTSLQVVAEEALNSRLGGLKKDRAEIEKRIEKTKAELIALMPRGKEERAKRLAQLEAALAAATTALDKQRRDVVRIDDLRKEVQRIRNVVAPQQLAKLKTVFQEAGLSEADWQAFRLDFVGDVDGVLTRRKNAITTSIKAAMEGEPWMPVDMKHEAPGRWPYNLLLAERDKVKEEVGIDAQKQRRYADLQRSLEKDERSFRRLESECENAETAPTRRQGHIERRRSLYVDVIQSYLDEQTVLERLYTPLQQVLADASGSLSRLRFAVSREVHLQQWVDAGEGLLDLRKESMLRGHGALAREAQRLLLPAWKTGGSDDVARALQKFIQEFHSEFKKSMPPTITATSTSEWWQHVASWLYGTDHIQMRYSITYDGVAIEQLSPGTRGIVLLLLYLVIDKHDRRPLVIDQPEENLDPKSVFEELVPHFREARRRRQVIIVTHNANLVVNTDADQVIVAFSERRDGVGLPKVSYYGGSLEDSDIRKAVCDILEGGERAFLDRERRYRLHCERMR